jgi:hypothetical protein
MPSIAALIFCYGLCFGIQNKVSFFHGKSEFTDKLLKCSYCTGFHAGWISFLLSLPLNGPVGFLGLLSGMVVWGFASAASCYILDTLTQYLEAQLSK